MVDTIYFGGRPIARLSGGAWTDLIYGPGGLLAEVPGTQTGAPVYRMTDHLGSLVGTLSSTGSVLSTQDVAPFGEVFSGSSTDRFVFTGKERDAESGLDYFGARYYGSNVLHDDVRVVTNALTSLSNSFSSPESPDTTATKAAQPPSFNPFTGEPGSTSQTAQPDGTPKQVRRYGPDRYPETDVDHDHDHTQGKPHAHDLGRPSDGSAPTHEDRGEGRPVRPTDPTPQ